MLLPLLEKHKASIHALAEQCGAASIRVFGSVARGEDTPSSDVDFVVSLPQGYDMFGQRLKLASALEDLLGHKVDLIPEHELNPRLKDRILSESIIL